MFRIQHAAKLAGINPTLLRAWERRYHLVAPKRTPSGYRVYSEADIGVLRAAARLVNAGHAISEVARLTPEQLSTAAAELDRQAGPTGPPPAEGDTEAAIEAALTAAMSGIALFDRAAFEAALFPLTTLAALPPVVLSERVLLPLLRRIGDEWEHGRLTVAAEHFGSALCRAKILQCLEFVVRNASGPRVVCACPENELHEGGLLAFAVHAAVAHWQVIYLGAHTPLAQALDTAVRIEAELVAISFTMPRRAAELDDLFTAVANTRRARPHLRVLAGGRFAMADRLRLGAGGIEVADDISAVLPGARVEDKKAPH